MTKAELRQTLLNTLGDIAPEANLGALRTRTCGKNSTSTPWTF
jgi:hypothetical protein